MNTPTTDQIRALCGNVPGFDQWLDSVRGEDWEEYAQEAGWIDPQGLTHTERLEWLDDLWADMDTDEREVWYINDKDWLLNDVVPLLRKDDTARYHDDMHHEGTVRWCTDAYCRGEA